MAGNLVAQLERLAAPRKSPRLIANQVQDGLSHVRVHRLGMPRLEPPSASKHPQRRLLNEILGIELPPSGPRQLAVSPSLHRWQTVLDEEIDGFGVGRRVVGRIDR
jgi:hypothetical protein